MTRTNRFLWTVQACPLDIAQANELLTLATELVLLANDGRKSQSADLMVAVRHDTQVDHRVIQAAGKAFHHVRTFRGRNRVDGWPAGCNNLLVETLGYFVTRPWDYTGILLTEPDTSPTTPTFLEDIHREWAATDKLVLGPLIGSFPGGKPGDGTTHINGNCMFAPEFARVYPEILHTTAMAWDAYHRAAMVQHGQPSRRIESLYKLGSPENPWPGCEALWAPRVQPDWHPLAGRPYVPSMIHGCKDSRVMDCVRARFLQQVGA